MLHKYCYCCSWKSEGRESSEWDRKVETVGKREEWTLSEMSKENSLMKWVSVPLDGKFAGHWCLLRILSQ